MRTIAAMAAAVVLGLPGCGQTPQYDTSSPQATLDAMRRMVADGHPELLGSVIHIQARDITFDDGVTEASAIQDVIHKASAMLGQLHRVASTIREQFPDAIASGSAPAPRQADAPPQTLQEILSRILADPFALLDQQHARLAVEDLGDGTAAILIDGKAAFGFGLQMRHINPPNGTWKVEVPIDLLQKHRPNTRHEWAVLASMMLAMENALITFEEELQRDKGGFRDLRDASQRAGRLLGERVLIQVMLYRGLKQRAQDT